MYKLNPNQSGNGKFSFESVSWWTFNLFASVFFACTLYMEHHTNLDSRLFVERLILLYFHYISHHMKEKYSPWIQSWMPNRWFNTYVCDHFHFLLFFFLLFHFLWNRFEWCIFEQATRFVPFSKVKKKFGLTKQTNIDRKQHENWIDISIKWIRNVKNVY